MFIRTTGISSLFPFTETFWGKTNPRCDLILNFQTLE